MINKLDSLLKDAEEKELKEKEEEE